ncbi:siderophore-interacting protein [Roseomonas sp. USHLN139]|uniref:siderophore-interacting protein n=1 Tax=Roseomonas sp. USHLN139 TaxID=3081298 RepID=UPI003B01FD67
MAELRSRTRISLSETEGVIEELTTLFTGHHAVVEPHDGAHRARIDDAAIDFELEGTALSMVVEAADPVALNAARHLATSMAAFVTRAQAPAIAWEGMTEGAATRPPDLRILRLLSHENLTPRMRRFVFTGEDLNRFDTPLHLHARLLFPPPGGVDPQWPLLGAQGEVIWPRGHALAQRLFTIRWIDAARERLAFDVFQHGQGGPAEAWFHAARPGDQLAMVGPGGHGMRSAKSHLLFGDETCLPGMARILEALPADAQGVAIIEVRDAADQMPLAHPSGILLRWLHRGSVRAPSGRLLADAVLAAIPPDLSTSIFVWGGGDAATYLLVRRHLRETLRLPKDAYVLYPYWKAGRRGDQLGEE